ncbi:Ribosomal RNA large subunit methyltransferase E [Nymphon striatum]|nr:Ribosomal RNA large subunit methyltransferase E [Nymphon striatum]
MAKSPTGPKGGKSGNTSGRGQRDLKVKVKSARGRTMSSTLWLQRQLNDPYVKRAKAEGLRGRAAFKISETDDKYRFLTPGKRVVDLGCAPGGWCQIAAKRVNALGERQGKAQGTVLGVDLQEVEPIPGCELHVLDFLEEGADDKVKEWLGGQADVVMSDMAAGILRPQANRPPAHHRPVRGGGVLSPSMFWKRVVSFVAKVLAGGAEGELQHILKQKFKKVANFKPGASRSDSSEKFVVATGFKGRDA